MRILLIKPDEFPIDAEIDGSLEEMQNLVEGHIQAFYPLSDPDVAIICNEEGKLQNNTLNRILVDEKGNVIDAIRGTFFLCAAPAGSEEFSSLSEEKINKYSYVFHYTIVNVSL